MYNQVLDESNTIQPDGQVSSGGGGGGDDLYRWPKLKRNLPLVNHLQLLPIADFQLSANVVGSFYYKSMSLIQWPTGVQSLHNVLHVHGQLEANSGERHLRFAFAQKQAKK